MLGIGGGGCRFVLVNNEGKPSIPAPRGRGTGVNPRNRFERLHLEPWPEDGECERATTVPTAYYRDDSRSLLSRNDADDLSFEFGINPYRGCEHGCAYCYARPYHEYLGFSAGLDFESRIMVKMNAAELLRRELTAPGYRVSRLAMSGVTDCYQPVERRLCLTRGCLAVLAELRHPVVVITKNHLVTRDVDHLAELARFGACAVYLSVTTLDRPLAAKLEPRASAPEHRLDAIRRLTEAGVPAGVACAPLIPGLTDHELPALLEAAADAGARFATYSMVRLPGAVVEVFGDWLDRHFPQRRDKVMERIRSLHGGRLNDSRPGIRMRGEGPWAGQAAQWHRLGCRRHGLETGPPEVSGAAFRKVSAGQPELDLGV